MVLLERQTKLLVVLCIFSLLLLVSACTMGEFDIITGRATSYIVEINPLGNDLECESDSDCGTDTYIGSSFCGEDGNVYQTYKEYRCLTAPGIADCRSYRSDKLVEACDSERGEVCAAGVNYCFVPPKDINNNGGMVTLECKTDIDCGEDGLSEKVYCLRETKLYADYREYDCNRGKCNVDRTPTLVKDCTPNYCDEETGDCSSLPPGVECRVGSDCGKEGYARVCRFGTETLKLTSFNCNQDKCLPRITYTFVKNCVKGEEKCVSNKGCVLLKNETNQTFEPEPILIKNMTLIKNITKPINVTLTNVTNIFTNVTLNETTNVTINETDNLTDQGDNQDKGIGENDPVKPIEVLSSGSQCSRDTDCGLASFTGLPYCDGNSIYAAFFDFTCKNGICEKNVKDKIFENCGKYRYCVDGDYVCHNKIVDLKIDKVIFVPGEPFIINKDIDIYLKLENLGYEDTLYGVTYTLFYPDGQEKTLNTPVQFEIGGYETKTVSLLTENYEQQGEHTLQFKVEASKEEYTYDNNEAEV
ncbi:MAG: hypothetical protein ABIE94_00285, partial [archaeon]